MRWPLGPIRQALTARVWLRHSLNVPIFLEVIHRMQRKKYERISRRITVLTLFHQMARLAGQIYFGRVIELFTLVFDGFQKTQSHHCLSTVPYCYLGVEPETDTGFLTTFRHQTGLLPADLEERDGMWAWQVCVRCVCTCGRALTSHRWAACSWSRTR